MGYMSERVWGGMSVECEGVRVWEMDFSEFDVYVQGVYARSLLGNASSSQAEMFKDLVQPLASEGCSFIE